MTPRVHILIQQIARMRVAGTKDCVIAAKLGMTQSGLSRILALQEYHDEEEAVLNGVVSKMDSALAGRGEELKTMLRQGVPVAVRALVEAATQSRDLRARIAAADKLIKLDPDKTFTENARLEDAAPSVSAGMLDRIGAEADKLTAAPTVKPQVVN